MISTAARRLTKAVASNRRKATRAAKAEHAAPVARPTRPAMAVRANRLLGGASVAAIALTAQGAHAQVTATGTQTTVTTVGAATKVETTNINAAKAIAFNSFSKFDVAASNEVTMVLPTDVKHLVNVVADKVIVNGTVTSRMGSASGAVGGNLFFVTSGGLMVGSTGIINTGALIVRGGTINTDSVADRNAVTVESLLAGGSTSSVDIQGRINAPGGIDVKADRFTLGGTGVLATGAAGLAGLRAIQGASVSTAGIVEGAKLVKTGGGIAIVGADEVTLATGTLIDARRSADLADLKAGVAIASEGAIKLGGTLTAWDGSSANAADITVAASKTTTIGGSFSGLTAALLDQYYARSKADASLTVTGAITGGVVSLTSDASASTAPGFNPVATTLQVLGDKLKGKLLDKAGLAIDAIVTRAEANSTITIGAGASVKAAGDLTVAATSTALAEGEAKAKLAGSSETALAIALGIAQVNATATVTVDGALEAGGALAVSAANDATSKLEVQAISTKTAKAAAVAYTEANVDASVKVTGTGKLTGDSVTVTATNAQAPDAANPSAEEPGFDTIAEVNATDGSAGGGAAAVSKIDILANVDLAGTLTSGGAVTVNATTDTNHINNAAKTETVPEAEEDPAHAARVVQLKAVNEGDSEKLLGAAVGGFASAFDKIVLGSDDASAGNGSSGGSPNRFGAAVGVVIDSQRAIANVAATVVATGKVAVDSLVKDASVRNVVKAAATSEADDGAGGHAIAGAAAWSRADYLSHATVGGTVTAAGLAVNAATERARGTEFDLELSDKGPSSDILAFAEKPMATLTDKLDLASGFFGNTAGATADTDDAAQAAIAGSVSYNEIKADTRAWIAPNAALTLSGDLTVKADTSLILLNLAGALPTEAAGGFATKGGNAGGIAVAFSKFDPTTVAGIGKGVVVARPTGTAAVNTDVAATTTLSAITLAPQAGQGNGITGSGTFATNLVAGSTLATVSKDARLDLGTGSFALKALSDLELWTVGGSVAVTEAGGDSKTLASIGVAGALNDVTLSTLARVIDTGETGTAASEAGITAGKVDLGATTRGGINAISVAGVSSNTTAPPAGEENAEDGQGGAEKKKGTFGHAKEKLAEAAALLGSSFLESAADYAEMADEYTSGIEDSVDAAKTKAQDTGGKSPATTGFGIAGSASVNLSDLTTRVETTGGRFVRAADGVAKDAGFSARALEQVDMMAITGGAAISKGKALSGSNTQLAGAYGLSYSNNATAAAITGGGIAGFGAVNVEALAKGSRIGAGLALAADTTGTKKGAALAASVSHLIARDGASATVADSAVTATTGSDAAIAAADRKPLSITAYNGLVIGAGAGGLSYGTGNGAGGAATVIDLAGSGGGDAAAAKLERTAVSGFGDLSVRALGAARIANIAAAFAVARGEKASALSAGISVNLISFDTTALIDTGATGLGKIDVGGAVRVFAGDDNTAPDTNRGLLGNYALGDTLGSDDPVDESQLKGGTRILSIAVPVAAGGKNGAGVGFAWNSIDNDRTAKIVGGGRTDGTAAIKAGSVSVKVADHADILALATGVGAGKGGVGLLGSVTRNIISGSSAATLGRSAGATSNLVVDVAAVPGSVPNVAVGATGDGGIFSLAGAIGIGKKGAAGLSVGVNDIVREKDGVATNAGLQAALDGVSFGGTPDVAVTADASGKIMGNAISLAAATNGAAFAGAATTNAIASTVSATAARLSYLNATTGDLKIAATDTSKITSNALVAGIGKDGGAAVGVSVNRIDADLKAALNVAAGDRIDVRNLVVSSRSTAATQTFGLGAGGGKTFGGSGSIAVNLTNSDVDALVGYTGGVLTTTGSVGVVARRDLTIDVGAGALAAGGNAAIGASVIVNDLGGSATARVVGDAANTGTITAFTGSGDESARTLTGLRTGEVAPLPGFEALDGFQKLALGTMIDAKVGDYKGVAVNASSTAATRTLAISGAFAGSGPAIGITGVVNNSTGTTAASIADAKVQVGGATRNDGIGIDVRASSQQVGVTFAGALAASGKVAAAAPVVSDAYSSTTRASVTGGALTSAGAITVKAVGNQASTALAAAGAVAGNAAGAVAAVSPRFGATVEALVTRPTGVTALGSGGFAVNADAASSATAAFATLAIAGQGAGAGAVVVATNASKTKASYDGIVDATTGLGAVTVDAAKVNVAANSDFQAKVAGASAAAAANFALVGNGVGVVHQGEVSAKANALRYDKALGGVAVTAKEQVAIATIVGQIAITPNPASAAAALGAVVVLGQSKVDAELSAPSIVNAKSVLVDAKGFNEIAALQLGAAIGGVGIGANVTYIGIGAVTDAGALTAKQGEGSSDEKTAAAAGTSSDGTSNSNLTQMSQGGGTSTAGIAGQTGNRTTAAERTSAVGTDGARNALTSVGKPGDSAAARVSAQVTGGTGTSRAFVHTDALTIDSDANLLSKSTNIQASAGIVAGSAAIGITRNAALSIAALGNVNAYGGTVAAPSGTVAINATTGEARGTNGITLPGGVVAPTRAAEASVVAGSVGVGAITVGVADVALQSVALAESKGHLGFDSAAITATDTTRAATDVTGVAAGAAAVNIAVSKALKGVDPFKDTNAPTVSASMGGTSNSNTLAVTSTALGGATAKTFAASGGILFAGNAAVALATDNRIVKATIDEGAKILAARGITVRASSTPSVTADSFGVTIGGTLAAGASVATAKSSGLVAAEVGERGTGGVDAAIVGPLTVVAESLRPSDGSDNVTATAVGSAGGYFAAVNGSVATADTTQATRAVVGANLTGSRGAALNQAGALTIGASRAIGQYASSTGVVGAIGFAVGVQRAESTSSGDARAAIENVDGSERGTDDATVTSYSGDRNRAKTVAGAGGLGAGIAADAITNTSSRAITEILTGADAFEAGKLVLKATTAPDYEANSDSTLATLAGGSGTKSVNTVNVESIVNVGNDRAGATGTNSIVRASDIVVKAESLMLSTGSTLTSGGSAKGAGGGVVTGQAASLSNSITQNATVNLRDGTTLRQRGGDIRLNEVGTQIDALINQSRRHSVALDVGGVMQLPFGEVSGTYNANTNVNLGNNVLVRADKGVGIGTQVVQSITDTAAIQIYGLAGLGGGKVDSTTNARSNIKVGSGSMIEAIGDVRVTTGRAANGVGLDSYRMAAQTDTFNNTLAPLNTQAGASATVTAVNTLQMGASTIRSARDVIVEAQADAGSPSAAGTGHNPYLQLLSISNKGGDTKTDTKGSIALNGTTLTAGYLNDRSVTVNDGAAGAASTIDGVSIGGTDGLVITTNNAKYFAATDTDALGGYAIGVTKSYSPYAEIQNTIAETVAKAIAAGLITKAEDLVDPATATNDKDRQALRDKINLAAARSSLLADLGTLYETRAAMDAAGMKDARPAVLIGGLTGEGSLFAAGGRVALGSDTITGTAAAKITAFGGPVIKLQNNTAYDTILQNVFIPFKVEGAVEFTGKANAVAGITLNADNTPNTGVKGQITVSTGPEKAKASNIIVTGLVNNIAGGFTAKTAFGNYVQFGQVNVANFSADSPNGLFTATLKNGTFSQGLPLAFWYGYGAALNNLSGAAIADYAASYVALNRLNLEKQVTSLGDLNAAFKNVFGKDSGDALTDIYLSQYHFLNAYGAKGAVNKSDPRDYPGDYSFGGVTYGSTGITAWGGCITAKCRIGSPGSDVGQKNGERTFGSYVFDGASKSTYEDDHLYSIVSNFHSAVTKINLASGNYNVAPETDSATAPIAKSQITATQVIINAKYVDVSGTITAGPIKERNLTINDGVSKQVYEKRYVDEYRYDEWGDRYRFRGFEDVLVGTQTRTLAEQLDALVGRADGQFKVDITTGKDGFSAIGTGSNLGAQFVGQRVDGVLTGQFVVDDVIAAGGGSITIAGKIVNSNSLGGGKLQVLNGYGNIQVVNNTGLDVAVGTINAGLSSEGRITLRDEGVTTEYVNSVGGQVMKTVFQGGYQKDAAGNDLLDKNGLRIPIATQSPAVALGAGVGIKGGSELHYDPLGRVYYVWRETVQISREVSDEAGKTNANSGRRDVKDSDQSSGGTFDQITVTPWTKAAGGQRPQVGQFIDLDKLTGNSYDASLVSLSGLTSNPNDDTSALNRVLGGGLDDFVQVITGKATRTLDYYLEDADNGRKKALIELPTAAEVSVLSAARANNPIRIEFDQGTGNGAGGLSISSNAGGRILVNGTLTYGGGTTTLSTNKSIVAGDKGVVISKDVSLTANDSIGTLDHGTGSSLVAGKAFAANLLGGSISAESRTGEVNLSLKSGTSVDGKPAPILVDRVVAQNGVKITADTSLGAVDPGSRGYNILSNAGDVTLDVGGAITGAPGQYYGAANIASSALKVDLDENAGRVLTVTAQGDVSIQQGSVFGTGTDRKLKVGRIETSGDVLLKAWGSVVAGDTTATVDQEKLERFMNAARALQLTPECKTTCGVVDPALLGGVDQAIRAEAYEAFDKLKTDNTDEFNAATATLIRIFGAVPAGRGSIATTPILLSRDEQIAYQVRTKGLDAYNRLAVFDPAATAEDSRTRAVDATVATIGKVVAFGATPGLTLSDKFDRVKALDLTAETLQPGGQLYQLALATLAAKNQAVVGTPTEADLVAGLDAYLADLRAPVQTLLPESLVSKDAFAAMTPAQRAKAVSDQLTTDTLRSWVVAENAVTQRTRASVDALGKLEQIETFRGNAGIQVAADGKTVFINGVVREKVGEEFVLVVKDATAFKTLETLQVGGRLYELALATLRGQGSKTGGVTETVPLPTYIDIQRGLQLYLDRLREPLLELLPTALPSLAGLDAGKRLDLVGKSITTGALDAWVAAQRTAARDDLKEVYGTTDLTRATLSTAALNATNLKERQNGSTWSAEMLAVQVPSTAFVPVADSQIVTRKPVILSRGLTLVAGNSIGDFENQNTFTYSKDGYSGTNNVSKDLAAAYLASSGPGDLRTDIAYNVAGDASSGVKSVSFTTRRDQPLQVNAFGTVNAVAGVNVGTIAGQGAGAASVESSGADVRGDIFLNNTSGVTIGTILSGKVRTGTTVTIPCNLGGDAAALCDSRIRLVAPDIRGVTTGASKVAIGGTYQSNADGSALVMGGLVRLEASNGSIVGTGGGNVKVDATALEVLRAAGTIALERRAGADIRADGFTQNFGNDLQLGDVFAGQALKIDNPVGSLKVVALPSNLASENRNSRLVTGVLSLRASGDIGSPFPSAAGIPGQFDIQAPIIQRLVSGYDFATGTIRTRTDGQTTDGLGSGSMWFALRGVTEIGADQAKNPELRAASMLGASGSITVGTIFDTLSGTAPIKSKVIFLTDITVGGNLNLTTKGDVAFPDETVRITGLGVASDANTVDLRKLNLTLEGKFEYENSRNILLGSLTAGGGRIWSKNGYVDIGGTLFGSGGFDTPFVIEGLKGVSVGTAGLGSMSFLSAQGDVTIREQSRATDLIARGINVSVGGNIFGRNAEIVASDTGTIKLGAVLLQRVPGQDATSNFTLKGGALTVGSIVSAQDGVVIEGRSITAAPGAMFLDSASLLLNAQGALNLDPGTKLVNIGSAVLRSGTAAQNGSAVAVGLFSGGSLDIVAPVGIAVGEIGARGAVTLDTGGTLAFGSSLYVGGGLRGNGTTIDFAPGAAIADAESVTLTATRAIHASTETAVQSRGAVTIATPGDLLLGRVAATGGSIEAGGLLAFGGSFASNGRDFTVRSTGGNVSFATAIDAAGSFGIHAAGDLSLGGAVTLNGGNGATDLILDSGGVLTIARAARITAGAPSAKVWIDAGSVAMDAFGSITGAAVSLYTPGAAMLGTITANQSLDQSVSLRAGGALSVGALTGATTTVASTGGAVTLRAAARTAALDVTAAGDITTAGITAAAATLNTSGGSVILNGTTRILQTASPAAAILGINALKAISIGGVASATGGIALTGASVATTGSGYLTDLDRVGALTTLRADTVNLAFNGGSNGSTATRIDARGRAGGNINDATFRFVGSRPITFDTLWVNSGSLTAVSAITVTSLTMRDYLWLASGSQSVALQGNGTPPKTASRTAKTGALTGAKLVMATPVSGKALAVSVNGQAK